MNFLLSIGKGFLVTMLVFFGLCVSLAGLGLFRDPDSHHHKTKKP